jgi:hypothetical protein
MNFLKLTVLVVWLLALEEAIRLGIMAAASAQAFNLKFDWFGFVVVILPAVFYPATSSWSRRQQIGPRRVPEWLSRRFERDRVERFVTAIQPFYLVATCALVAGLACLINGVRIGAPGGAYVAGGFLISTFIGLLLRREIQKRGRL